MTERRVFDPDDPAHLQEGVPFDELAELRRKSPIARTPAGAWFLSRRQEIDQILMDVDELYLHAPQWDLLYLVGRPRDICVMPGTQHRWGCSAGRARRTDPKWSLASGTCGTPGRRGDAS